MITTNLEREDMIQRGLRIKHIRENELHMTKTKLAKEIGTSSQFLGVVEDGKGNLMYENLHKLREISNHSADYILFGIDDEVLKKTKILLQRCSELELINAAEIIKRMAIFIRNN